MTRIARRAPLIVAAIASALVLAYFLLHPEIARDPVVPSDVPALAAWLHDHPADAIAGSKLSVLALDSDVQQRRALWLASHEHASYLSPLRPNAAAGFVRAGLFHWYELNDVDRKRVLDAAAPLMHQPRFFSRLFEPIWNLTRDFDYLRRVAPDSVAVLDDLRRLALMRGLFPQYRETREALRRRTLAEVQARRAAGASLNELLETVPQHLDAADAPIARAILEELDRRPFEPEQINGRIDGAVTLALDHDFGPLTGIAPLVEIRGPLRDVTRARAALAIHNPTLASRVEITTEVPGMAEWTPYHLERAIFEAKKGDAAAAEGQLREAQQNVMTSDVAATQLEVATLLGNPSKVAAARAQLAELSARPISWSNTCTPNEICTSASTSRYLFDAHETIPITLTSSQGDETPAYVEIYVNDALAAEGEVRVSRRFELKPGAGLQRIEVRLVNRTTRNNLQRRLRLS
jgi:hypothetical protein